MGMPKHPRKTSRKRQVGRPKKPMGQRYRKNSTEKKVKKS